MQIILSIITITKSINANAVKILANMIILYKANYFNTIMYEYDLKGQVKHDAEGESKWGKSGSPGL